MTDPTSSETAAPAAPGAASPALEVQRQYEDNKKAWDTWRENWTPAIPEENGLVFARRDVELRAQLTALETGTTAATAQADQARDAVTAQRVAAFTAPWTIAGTPLSDEGRALAEVVATVLPPELHVAGREAMERAATLAQEAAAWPAAKREDELEDALRQQWGASYDIEMDSAEAAFDLLGKGGRAYVTSQRLHTHPGFWQLMAQMGEQFLGTDEGIRWRLAHPRAPVDFLHE